jgi:DNA primase
MTTEDLLALVQQATPLKHVSAHRGGEYHGACPFCGGTDRFRVQPERDFWACRQCGKSGDRIAFLVETGRLSSAEAYEARHSTEPSLSPPSAPALPVTAMPPTLVWQTRAWELVVQAQDALWSARGARALAWLRRRGLTEANISRAGLGYQITDTWENRADWGLPLEADKPKPVWLPRGIVIPWFIGADLWRINIRRPAGDPKYIGPAGFGNALYNADQITPDRPVVLVEGELDALSLEQTANDLVVPAATGSVSGARRARWIATLAIAPLVLIAFDADQAGDEARQYWLRVLPNSQYWRPFWGDANAMHQGDSIREWMLAGLKHYRT